MEKYFYIEDSEADVSMSVESNFNLNHECQEPTLSMSLAGECDFGFDSLGIALTRKMTENLVNHLQNALKSPDINFTKTFGERND